MTRARRLAVPGLLLLAACGGDPATTSGSRGATDGSAAPRTAETPSDTAAWNPCDGLEPDPIAVALGSEVTVDDGDGQVYRCSVLPVADGDATMSLTYQWGAGSLSEIWETMEIEPAKARKVRVPGADDARLVVDAGDRAVAVTGFVQTGELIQVVNALDLPPYDAERVVAGTTVVLEQLAAAAPESP